MNKRFEPRPEQPIELRHDKERHENRADQCADGARDQAKRDDRERNDLRKRHDNQEQPVQQIGQDRPRIGLDELLPELIEMIKHELQ